MAKLEKFNSSSLESIELFNNIQKSISQRVITPSKIGPYYLRETIGECAFSIKLANLEI